MNPQVFGKAHLLYIAVSIVTALVVCLLTARFAKTEKAQNAVMKFAGGVLFAIIFANRLALVFEYEEANWLKLITDSFCSTSSYVLSLALIFGKRDNKVLHFAWLISLAGGEYSDAEDMVDALTLDDWSDILADMRFDDDFIYLDDILEEGPAERSEEVLKENRKTYGCEKIETLALEIELDGEDMYLCMDVACYDGKWYCLTQGGMIGSLMGIPMLHGGVAIE